MQDGRYPGVLRNQVTALFVREIFIIFSSGMFIAPEGHEHSFNAVILYERVKHDGFHEVVTLIRLSFKGE